MRRPGKRGGMGQRRNAGSGIDAQAMIQSGTPVRLAWMRNSFEVGRSSAALADGASPYRDASVGELLI